MIPLRSTEGVDKFPVPSLAWIGILVFLEFLARIWPGSHALFLTRVAFIPVLHQSWWHPAFLFHPNLLSLVVNLIFIWAFTPTLFSRCPVWICAIFGVGGAYLAYVSFSLIHPFAEAPLIAPEALTGVWLGMYMRRDIWGSVDTLVVGPGWLRVLSVPSYVLLFFWFFYLLLVNLFLNAPFSDAPMLYWIGFAAFLIGFVLESTRAAVN